MGFLRSSGNRKKKSYIHDDAEESARRRDMIKQKLYAEHMMDSDDENDDYLEKQLGPRSPVRRLSPHNSQSSRRVTVLPNYIDPSGSLRNSPPSSGHFRAPPRRAYSEQNGRKTLNRPPPLPPRRTNSFANGSDEFSQGSSPSPPSRGKNARFSMAPHPVHPSRRDPRMASRLANRNYNNAQDSEDDEDEDGIGEQMMTPLAQRRPPPRRRRATVAEQSLQKNADAAMRFGPPRRVKSHYPGGRNPRGVGTIGMIDNGMDASDHSNVSKDSSDKGVFRGRGLFRNKSGQSDDTDLTVSSSERSSSFFRKVKRTNSSSMKRSPLDTSEHTTESQKSWFTNGSARSKEEVYNSALRRVKERQAIQNAQNYLRGNQPGRMGLSEQLAALPPANDSDAEYDEVEDDAESKSIFSSIISKIEKVYDDCS